MAQSESQTGVQSRVTQDPHQIERVITSMFLKIDVRLHDPSGEAAVRVTSYAEGRLTVEHDRPPGPVRLLSVLHRDHRWVLECRVSDRLADGTEQLEPSRLHLRPARAAPRVSVSQKDSGVFVTECVPIEAIPATLSNMNPKRDSISRAYSKALHERFNDRASVELRLRRTMRLDPHMRLMQATRRPIFAPHRTEKSAWSIVEPGGFVSYEQYGDIRRYESDSGIVGEMAYPLWYRGRFLYGYLHVRARDTCTLAGWQMVEAVAMKLDSEFKANQCLPENPERCPIADISRGGVGFDYPHQGAFKGALMPGADLMLDLQIGEARVTVEGAIKNVRSQERTHRLGIQFEQIAPDDLELLEQFLRARLQSG